MEIFKILYIILLLFDREGKVICSCDLFNDSVFNSEYIVLNNAMSNEQ